MSARYLTTTLPYVNADPHLGHALEFVQADALARTWRLAGDTVFFSTGTDEHGQKIYGAAEKAGQDVRAYADHYANEFRKLGAALNISNDAFIRTIEPRHYAAAAEMWRRCDTAGDIYKKSFTGMYCVGCESFKTEKEMAGGHCIVHTNLQPQEITEENYFFRFSKYADRLLEYLSRPGTIIPEWRKEEAIAFVKGGLADFSISREKKRLSWGIPVPNDDTQVMYVWFDALTNYISTLDWPEDTKGNFKKFWEEGRTVQVGGKDQVRFQSLMWQAMLMSAGIKNTDQIFYHGFITSGGQKMSKSLGNVISPYDLVKKYGTDATRYMLLRHVNPMEDSDVTWERLDEWYTANLANGLGNLVARVMKLAEQYLDSEKDTPIEIEIGDDVFEELNSFSFNDALDLVFLQIATTDLLMNEKEPFKKLKSEDSAIVDEGREVLRHLLGRLARIANDLRPFLPATSEKILIAIRGNKKPDNLFPRL